MKQDTHPEYHEVEASCVCGATFLIGTTKKDPIRVEVCSNCHPFYLGTGRNAVLDVEGRIDKFRSKYARKKKAA